MSLAALLDDGSFAATRVARASSEPARCAHRIPVGQPCWSCLLQRADRVAETNAVVRSMLAECPGSRWRTRELQGTSRRPLYGDLAAAVERAS
jgi:hypothetical protein